MDKVEDYEIRPKFVLVEEIGQTQRRKETIRNVDLKGVKFSEILEATKVMLHVPVCEIITF